MTNGFLTNILRGVRLRLKKLFYNPFSKAGINSYRVKIIKNQPDSALHGCSLLNGKVQFYNSVEFLYGVKEIFVDEIYKIQLPLNAYILDCGAHIGLSVLYFKHCFPDCQIVAYEPDKTNYTLLCKNVSAFGHKNVDIRNEAVWVNNTELLFSGEGNMSSKINTNAITQQTDVKVNAIRLKEMINRKINFLKLDIEGAEYEVLKDIATELHFVDNMFLEYHGSFMQNIELNEMLDIVTNAGFQYYIKEAAVVYPTPFLRNKIQAGFDVQLNIFCFKRN